MSIEQHPIGKSIFLHIYTGIAIMVFRLIITPYTLLSGFPPVFAGILAFILISIPLQLGYMLYQGKEKNGVFSLQSIVVYRQPIPVSQYIVLPTLLVFVFFIVSILTAPVNGFLADRASSRFLN